MTKFVELKGLDGNDDRSVVVNVDRITFVRPRENGAGVYIDFGTQKGVAVNGTLRQVMNALEAEPMPL